MQVKINDRVYCVEFSTGAKRPKYGNDKDHKVLVETNCVIRRQGSKGISGRGYASQNYRDELNWQEGRKYSLKRALAQANFKKDTRESFWNKYKEKYPIKSR